MKSVVWYHCVSSGLVISAISLFAYCSVGVGISCQVLVRFACYIPTYPFWWPYSTRWALFSSLMCVAVNVDVQSSSHSFPMDISAPDCGWGRCVVYFSL